MLREVKMTGGGRSHVRTLLRLQYPANREKYREFCESSRLFPIVRGCNRLVVYNFCSNSQLEPLNRTGNYQGRIRELNSLLLGTRRKSARFCISKEYY